ncbi:MAG: peptide deformylase [Pirellula sp.]|jgi:peptide deformylase
MDHNSFFTSAAYARLLSEKHMLQLIQYPHPTLRFPSKPLSRVDEALREIIDQMFEIMYEHRGVGLAANQVNLPLRLFIANPTGEKESGQELVFLNPVIQKATGTIEAEEGCLSLPGLHGLVKRNKAVQVNAYSMDGKEINLKVEGFLARIIQHEVDHLDGVLFIDRLFDQGPKVAEEISRFEARFAKQREEGHITDDQKLAEQRQDWLDKYCK